MPLALLPLGSAPTAAPSFAFIPPLGNIAGNLPQPEFRPRQAPHTAFKLDSTQVPTKQIDGPEELLTQLKDPAPATRALKQLADAITHGNRAEILQERIRQLYRSLPSDGLIQLQGEMLVNRMLAASSRPHVKALQASVAARPSPKPSPYSASASYWQYAQFIKKFTPTRGVGRYGLTPEQLTASGYLKPGAAPDDSSSWSGRYEIFSKEQFENHPEAQLDAMMRLEAAQLTQLRTIKNENVNKAGFVKAAMFFGAEPVLDYLRQEQQTPPMHAQDPQQSPQPDSPSIQQVLDQFASFALPTPVLWPNGENVFVFGVANELQLYPTNSPEFLDGNQRACLQSNGHREQKMPCYTVNFPLSAMYNANEQTLQLDLSLRTLNNGGLELMLSRTNGMTLPRDLVKGFKQAALQYSFGDERIPESQKLVAFVQQLTQAASHTPLNLQSLRGDPATARISLYEPTPQRNNWPYASPPNSPAMQLHPQRWQQAYDIGTGAFISAAAFAAAGVIAQGARQTLQLVRYTRQRLR